MGELVNETLDSKLVKFAEKILTKTLKSIWLTNLSLKKNLSKILKVFQISKYFVQLIL